ncbi:hypothetical protein Enr8_34880 [Blastopirellula retiformator]|uniref:Uncharacterized protein n=1 Tax=Blastopirellula retiformator TaxID=2527970 RepID=A0A5C5UYX3_9BACT|nr:hypothetical protein Enr8_34880 [Blastopirellula retiformator]
MQQYSFITLTLVEGFTNLTAKAVLGRLSL